MKRIDRQTLITIAVGATLLVIGAIGGWWWSQGTKIVMEKETQPETRPNSAVGQPQVLYWYDPMHPQQHFDKPGKSPFMDMALVPKYADSDDPSTGLKIDPSITQNLGMRLAAVKRIALASQIDATGVLALNERDVAIVQSRTAGFIARIAPLAAGDVVQRGQALAEIEAPEWLAAQHEFLALQSAGDPALLTAARERLRSLGMSVMSIRDIESKGRPSASFTLVAPIGGVIQSLDTRNGMTLTSGQTIARINGLSSVWLEIAVPEALASQVQIGMEATAIVAGSDTRNTSVHGKVAAIVPVLNDASRSVRVRVELPNPQGKLRPGMSAQVALKQTETAKDSALAVPTEALIRTGKRTLVIVAMEGGKYLPTEVSLGREIGDQTVITAGLNEGQQIVASGQFLIDSEASLKGIGVKGIDAKTLEGIEGIEGIEGNKP